VSRDTALRVVLVFPGLLGTYGDRGNALVLRWRAERRGYTTELVEVAPGEPVPRSGDLYLLGGGEDEAQAMAADLLVADGGLAAALAGGAQLLAVCAGLQLVGESFVDSTGRSRPGLGLVDAATVQVDAPRAVGEVVVEPTAPGVALPLLTGYENHAGRTVLGPGATPLGRVQRGVGNGDGDEGVVSDRIVGTYLHGPVLARNPSLADLLLQRTVGEPLAPLEAPEVDVLREERLREALGSPGSAR
jgi:CobQ-like glutamine amidotransferase family enzyme